MGLLGYCKVANELLELLEVALIPTGRDSERDLPSRGMISHVVVEMESQVELTNFTREKNRIRARM